MLHYVGICSDVGAFLPVYGANEVHAEKPPLSEFWSQAAATTDRTTGASPAPGSPVKLDTIQSVRALQLPLPAQVAADRGSALNSPGDSPRVRGASLIGTIGYMVGERNCCLSNLRSSNYNSTVPCDM
jgi:hypothetical protein